MPLTRIKLSSITVPSANVGAVVTVQSNGTLAEQVPEPVINPLLLAGMGG
jgi:hypothetical protein